MFPLIRHTVAIASFLALSLFLLGATPGRAAVNVDLVWTGTTGAGIPGGSTIHAAPGDELTAEIRVTPDPTGAGICCAALSIAFDPDLGDELNLISASESTAPPSPLAPLTFGIEGSQESSSSQGGLLLSFEGVNATSGAIGSPFTLGTVVFRVTGSVTTDGPDVFTGAFNSGVDAIGNLASLDVTGTVVFGSAAVDAGAAAAVPGLGVWAAVLAVGTLALAGMARARGVAVRRR